MTRDEEADREQRRIRLGIAILGDHRTYMYTWIRLQPWVWWRRVVSKSRARTRCNKHRPTMLDRIPIHEVRKAWGEMLLTT